MKIEISDDKSSATIDGVEYELKQKGKKISEWLNDLPDGYRELALANFKEQGKKDKTLNSIDTSLREFSDWHKTKEGNDFWYDVMSFYIGTEDELPPLPKPKFEVWKPKVDDLIYEISYNGDVEDGRFFSDQCFYTAFKTEAEAVEAHEKAMFNYEVEMFIKEKNGGWIPDWTDFMQIKCSLCVNYYKGQEILINEGTYVCISGQQKHFKSKEIGEEIIAKFDNEKLVKYWI